MSEILIHFLEVMLYAIPALIVFATVYFLFKKFMDSQMQLQMMQYRHRESKNILPLKLQAYERLTLFVERIKPDSMMLRLNDTGLNGRTMRNMMMISVQKEYEHNLTQQIYVSENLWKIITIAKDELIRVISDSEPPPEQSAQEFGSELLLSFSKLKLNPLDQAQRAIKEEVSFMIGKY